MEDIKHTSLIELKNRLDEIEKEKQDILEEMDRRFPGMGRKISYQEAEVEVVDELLNNLSISVKPFVIREQSKDEMER